MRPVPAPMIIPTAAPMRAPLIMPVIPGMQKDRSHRILAAKAPVIAPAIWPIGSILPSGFLENMSTF